MLKAAILFAVGAVSIAVLAPSFLPDTATPPQSAVAVANAPAADASPAQANAPASGYRQAVLRADPRGQYAADAFVNGMPVRMLVDTGASVVVLSAATAARLGVATGRAQLRMQTANGPVDGSPVVLKAIRLGGLAMYDIPAVVLPREAGDANLLGATFLKRLVSVEQRSGFLILRQ